MVDRGANVLLEALKYASLDISSVFWTPCMRLKLSLKTWWGLCVNGTAINRSSRQDNKEKMIRIILASTTTRLGELYKVRCRRNYKGTCPPFPQISTFGTHLALQIHTRGNLSTHATRHRPLTLNKVLVFGNIQPITKMTFKVGEKAVGPISFGLMGKLSKSTRSYNL